MATRNKKPTGNRLAEIVAYRRSQGSSVTGSLAGGIKERLKEKFDPRQLLNQRGLLTALFPGLKTYSAKTAATELSKASSQIVSFDEIKPTLETISYNTKMTAKNTMVLPALHRDVNVIRQNMVKLVKLKGEDARTKADMYFVNAKEREEKYERELKKEMRKYDLLNKKEEKDNEKDKSIFLKIFGVVSDGLKGILNGIFKLGKTLISAFGFLTNGVANVIKGLLSLIIGDKIGSYLKKFFESKGLFRKLFESILTASFGSIIRAIFSNRFLGLLSSVLITSWFAEGPWAKYRNQKPTDLMKEEIPFTENIEKSLPLPSEKILDEQEIQKGKELGLLPESFQKGNIIGGREGKPFEIKDQQEALDKYNSKYFEEYRKGERKPYALRAPGVLSSGSVFFLTQKEAEQWGKKTRNYLFLIKKIAELLKKKNRTDSDENNIKSLTSDYYKLRDSMLMDFWNLTNDQLKPSPEKAGLMGMVKNRLESDNKDVSLLENTISELYSDLTSTSAYKQGEKFIKDEFDKFESDFSKTILDNVNVNKKSIDDLKNKLNLDFSNYAKSIEEKSLDNRRQSVVFKQPVVVNNQSVVKKNNPINQLGTPASAWNNDFIDKYFDDIIKNPLGIK